MQNPSRPCISRSCIKRKINLKFLFSHVLVRTEQQFKKIFSSPVTPIWKLLDVKQHPFGVFKYFTTLVQVVRYFINKKLFPKMAKCNATPNAGV